MKKTVILGVIFTVLIALIVYVYIDANNRMKIAPAHLSKGENEILEMTGHENNANVYDYVMDNSIKTVNVDFKELDDNGKWKDIKTYKFYNNSSDKSFVSNRIFISYSEVDGNVRIFCKEKNGSSSIAEDIGAGFGKDGIIGRTWENRKVEIAEGKALPLALFYRDLGDSVDIYNSDYLFQREDFFSNTEHLIQLDDVIAVTITFSKD